MSLHRGYCSTRLLRDHPLGEEMELLSPNQEQGQEVGEAEGRLLSPAVLVPCALWCPSSCSPHCATA